MNNFLVYRLQKTDHLSQVETKLAKERNWIFLKYLDEGIFVKVFAASDLDWINFMQMWAVIYTHQFQHDQLDFFCNPNFYTVTLLRFQGTL